MRGRGTGTRWSGRRAILGGYAGLGLGWIGFIGINWIGMDWMGLGSDDTIDRDGKATSF